MGLGAGRVEYRCGANYVNPWPDNLGGFLKAFFIKPKPVIEDLPVEERECSPFESVVISGKEVNLYGCKCKELYINVRNDGKSSIKRLRARVKIYPIRSFTTGGHMDRPQGISDADWEIMKKGYEEMDNVVESEIRKNQFGRGMPFSRTLKGTTAIPWVQVDGGYSYEIDLAPKNDEANVKLVGIYPLDRIARNQLTGTGINFPEDSRTFPAYVQIGYRSIRMTSRLDNESIEEIAVKFWIIAENLTDEVSKTFHIEIPASLDTIRCRPAQRHERKKINKLLNE